jgi:hypothetical protein
MSKRTVHKVIQVHSSEAEAISKAFREARVASETILARLNKIYALLDQEWEGNQEEIFQGALDGSIERISNVLLPQLRFWEHKYQVYMVDKLIDEVV